MQRTEERERQRSRGVTKRAASAAGRVFSPTVFAVSLLVAVAGAFLAGGAIPFLGGLGSLVGVFAAGAVVGWWRGRAHYLEVGAAGAGAVAVASLLNQFVFVLLGIGLPLVLVGAGAGFLTAIAGHYAGRDLKAGLTREL